MKKFFSSPAVKMATLSSFLALVPPLGAAQSSLDARSFDDLSDTPEASAENALSDASGGLGSKAERLQCLKGLNPSGNSGAVKLKVEMGTCRIYSPSTDAFDTV